jgi:hypothetical protein
MHVHTETTLSADQVKTTFEAVQEAQGPCTTSSRTLRYASNRTPPKFFLNAAPVTFPASAEVSLYPRPQGADVVLRLMWGPLPAPFPRAVAAGGVLLGLLIAIFSDRTVGDWVLASLIALLPLAALLYQQRGERELQTQLSRILGGTLFLPKPH